MKKMLFVLTGFAALIAGAYSTSYLFAQGGGTAQPQPGTKVAVINIGHVFNNYSRAKAFKAQLEESLAPYKTKAKKLSDEIKAWEDEVRKPGVDNNKADQYRNLALRNKRELEDMNMEISKLLGKKQEDNLVTLWKEVNVGITKVAEAYGFQIVFGFGDPMEKELLNLFPNVNRKMQAMDLGSSIPLYVHGSVDLSHAVTETLNRWVEPKNDVKQTGGTK